MVNNHGFLTKNRQKTTKKPKKPIKTNDLPRFPNNFNYLHLIVPVSQYTQTPHNDPPTRLQARAPEPPVTNHLLLTMVSNDGY